MFDYLLSTTKKGKQFLFSDTGPGPRNVLNGDDDAGFFGEVLPSELITGDALSSVIGITEGTSINSNTNWLKFYIDDKILFIPKLPIRHSITWSTIYNFGCVYGTDDKGVAIIGGGVNQNKVINVQGYYFRVRLLKGLNPENGIEATVGDDVPYSHNSEWNRLFYNITPTGDKYPQTSQTGTDWASYTDIELGMSAGVTASKTWCQEQYDIDTNSRISRSGPNAIRLFSDAVTSTSNQFTWRPVLELITDEINPPINVLGSLFAPELFTEDIMFLSPINLTSVFVPDQTNIL